MGKYIDKEALRSKIRQSANDVADVQSIISSMPSVDVAQEWRWISVEDSMPELGVPVLVCSPSWDYGVVANYDITGAWRYAWGNRRLSCKPKYWLPLPVPPGQDKS